MGLCWAIHRARRKSVERKTEIKEIELNGDSAGSRGGKMERRDRDRTCALLVLVTEGKNLRDREAQNLCESVYSEGCNLDK